VSEQPVERAFSDPELIELAKQETVDRLRQRINQFAVCEPYANVKEFDLANPDCCTVISWNTPQAACHPLLEDGLFTEELKHDAAVIVAFSCRQNGVHVGYGEVIAPFRRNGGWPRSLQTLGVRPAPYAQERCRAADN